MCICMRDEELTVRESTLSLMIQLIQEDYLKLRCPVFFHILTMLLDREQHIRDMVSSFLINSLLIKKKNIMVQHFVESLFHYNGYTVSMLILIVCTVKDNVYFCVLLHVVILKKSIRVVCTYAQQGCFQILIGGKLMNHPLILHIVDYVWKQLHFSLFHYSLLTNS